jgi:hypothetical protein
MLNVKSLPFVINRKFGAADCKLERSLTPIQKSNHDFAVLQFITQSVYRLRYTGV